MGPSLQLVGWDGKSLFIGQKKEAPVNITVHLFLSLFMALQAQSKLSPPCRLVINVHRGVTVPAGDTVCQMNVIPRVAFTFNATPSEALQEPVGANPIHSC